MHFTIYQRSTKFKPMKTIRTIVIDDEDKLRKMLIDILKKYCQNIEIIGEAANVTDGVEIVKQLLPDLIFLDINMPDGTGFDLLSQVKDINFKLIFVTAYEEYAVKAIKFSALDYILKPIDFDEVILAIDKARDIINQEAYNTKLDSLLSNIESPSKENKKIALNTSSNIYIVNVGDIIRCESDKNYTTFYLDTGKKLVVSRTIKEFDELLSSYDFFRTHKSHLVNIAYIKQYEKRDGGYIVLKDDSTVPVSLRKKEQLIKLFESL